MRTLSCLSARITTLKESSLQQRNPVFQWNTTQQRKASDAVQDSPAGSWNTSKQTKKSKQGGCAEHIQCPDSQDPTQCQTKNERVNTQLNPGQQHEGECAQTEQLCCRMQPFGGKQGNFTGAAQSRQHAEVEDHDAAQLPEPLDGVLTGYGDRDGSADQQAQINKGFHSKEQNVNQTQHAED